jgi:hypothetical protein
MTPIEAAIVEKLRESGSCCLDDVVTSLSNSNWGEVFAAVNRMSRDGWLVLHQLGYSSYQLSIAPQFAHSPSSSTQMGQPSGDMARPQVSA